MSRMNAVRNAAKMGVAGGVAGVAGGVATDQDASTTLKMGLAGAIGTAGGAGAGALMPATRGVGRSAVDAVKAMRGTKAYGSGIMNKARGMGKYMRADLGNFGSRFGSSRKAIGIGALGGGAAGMGYASNSLSSNSKVNGIDYDAKFEYMRKVKKMQVEQNLDMAERLRSMKS